MKKNTWFAIPFLLTSTILYSNQSFAGRWAALPECKIYAKETREKLPVRLDDVTIWTDAVCVASGSGVIARYSYTLLIPESKAFPYYVKETVYAGLVNSWCANPDLREFLNKVDIEAVYTHKNGKFITSLRVTKDMC